MMGSYVSAKDTFGDWFLSKILGTRAYGEKCSIEIHYVGFEARWDEWIDLPSPRILKIGAVALKPLGCRATSAEISEAAAVREGVSFPPPYKTQLLLESESSISRAPVHVYSIEGRLGKLLPAMLIDVRSPTSLWVSGRVVAVSDARNKVLIEYLHDSHANEWISVFSTRLDLYCTHSKTSPRQKVAQPPHLPQCLPPQHLLQLPP
jgi:hypothetical protein